MHELAIAEGVVAAVLERLPEAKVTGVRLEIGMLSGVLASPLRFCFDLVTDGTNLEGATLDIDEPAASCECRDCGAKFELDCPIVLCDCGGADVAVLSGTELRIVSVQVA